MATLTVRYKYQLVNHRRNRHLHRHIDIAGLVWNHAIALQRRYYKLTGKYISRFDMQKHLAKLRRRSPRFSHWKMLYAKPLQELCLRLHLAYQRFFKRISGLPKFRKVKKYQSVTYYEYGNGVQLGEINKGKYRDIIIQGRQYSFYYSRELPSLPKQVTLKRTPDGKLWLSFVVQVAYDEVKVTSGKIAGFDFGLMRYLTVNDGSSITSPLYLFSMLDNPT